ncbi:hypothetical protein JCM19992_01990 [Thermostilla marina]
MLSRLVSILLAIAFFFVGAFPIQAEGITLTPEQESLLASAGEKAARLKAYVDSRPTMTYNKRLALTALLTAEYTFVYLEQDIAGKSKIDEAITDQTNDEWEREIDHGWLANYPQGCLEHLHRVLDETLAAIADPAGDRGEVFDPIAAEMDRAVPHGNHVRLGDRPVFPYGMCFFTSPKAVDAKYGDRSCKIFDVMGGTAAVPGNLQPSTSHTLNPAKTRDVAERIQRADALDLFFSPWIGQKGTGWIGKQFPEFLVSRTMIEYDISHPAGMALVEGFFYGLGRAHAAANTGGIPRVYIMFNEPHYSIEKDSWNGAPISPSGMDQFRDWLQAKYGTIDKLNASWNSDWKAFSQVEIDTPIDTALRGTPVWYDAMRFNMDRFTDFFRTERDMIRAGDPGALTTIKLMGHCFWGDGRNHGLDHEALCHIQDVLGADLTFKSYLAEPPWRRKKMDPRYIDSNWAGQAMFYAFCRSICPDKAFFDSEFHGLPSALDAHPTKPEEWVRSGLWAMHIAGVDIVNAWCYLRDAEGRVNPNWELHSEFSNDPAALFTFAKTMHEINDLAGLVVAFQNIEPDVYLYYSEDSAIQDPEYMPRMLNAYTTLYYNGIESGFVTANMLREGFRPQGLLIVPQPTFLSDDEAAVLLRAMRSVDTIYLGGDPGEHDAEGHPRTQPPTLPQSVVRQESLDLAPVRALPSVRAKTAVTVEAESDVPGLLRRSVRYHDREYIFCLNMLSVPAVVTVHAASIREFTDGRVVPCATRFELRPGCMKLLRVD